MQSASLSSHTDNLCGRQVPRISLMCEIEENKQKNNPGSQTENTLVVARRGGGRNR